MREWKREGVRGMREMEKNFEHEKRKRMEEREREWER